MRITILTACLALVLAATASAQVIFTEPFDNNTAGWTLGIEWQIGAATAGGNGSGVGFPDPGMDAQGTPGGGVAGVVIGGDAATATIHPFDYITSPVIDTTVIPSPTLSFQRWLNSDYSPFMTNVVEVFDGLTWVTIWGPEPQNSTPITDSAWNLWTFDVTAYTNAAFQFRFGFDIGSTGAYNISSWNIDDVTIFNAVVPYPGTPGGDVLLGTGVNAAPTSGLGQYVKTATGLDAINLLVSSPMGSYDGQPYVLLTQPFTTGTPPTPTIPGLVYLDLAQPFVILVNIDPFLGQILNPGGTPYGFIMPFGFAGQSFIFQAACVTPALSISDGYELQVL